ncbi:hypothetical protein HAX54_025532, partial [Datura stramonium]|nr:hypothetical protein [Datura stramonium]
YNHYCTEPGPLSSVLFLDVTHVLSVALNKNRAKHDPLPHSLPLTTIIHGRDEAHPSTQGELPSEVSKTAPDSSPKPSVTALDD